MELTTKQCGTCKQAKALEEFCRSSSYKDGLNYRCRACSAEAQRKHYQNPENRKKQTARAKRQRAAREHYREMEKKRYYNHPERFAAASRKYLLRKWGLTSEQFEQMLQNQGGGCAICGATENSPGSKGKSLAVDHDHTTGKVRGLLCDKCNRALGWLGEDHQRFIRAAEYLQKHKED